MNTFLRHCRSHFLHAGIFSLFINLLLLTVPLYMLQVYDRVLSSRVSETLWMLSVVAAGALVVYFALDVLRGRLLLAAGVALDGLASPPVLAGVLKKVGRTGGGAYVTGLKDVATLRGFLTGNGIVALFDLPWLPIFLAVIFCFHWALGVAATVGAAALLALAVLNEFASRKPSGEIAKLAHNASRYVDAGVRNAEVVNALGMQGEFQSSWQILNDRVLDTQVVLSRRGGLFSSLSKFARLFLQVLMLGVGATLVIHQEVTAGVMIAGTLILARALAPVESAVATWKGLVEARAAFRRLQELLAAKGVDNAKLELPQPTGKLECERIVCAVPGSDRIVLKGLGFALSAGDSLGLIGPSASGKSTLARVLMGIWTPQGGTVRLDGADLAQWPREALGPHVGYLPQDVQLMQGTVAENIARLASGRDHEVIAAAQRAHAHELILRLPKGYETEVGEGGCNLSGGQRQRIALARALFGNPRFVVLDEPNANLDSEGEAALVAAMNELRAGGATLIVISHRPSLLSGMDKLLVLKDGQIELFGPNADVMARLNRAAVVPLNINKEMRTA